MMDNLMRLDKEWMVYLNNLGSQTWDPFWLWVSEMNSWIPLYLILLVYIFFRFTWKESLLIIALTLLGVAVVDSSSNFVETWVGRPRPCHEQALINLLRLVKTSCGGRFGFYSAHAANHMFLAIFLGSAISSRSKWFLGLMLIWASVIGYSRIYIGVHYPLDVLAGLTMGAMVAFLAFYFYKLFLGSEIFSKL